MPGECLEGTVRQTFLVSAGAISRGSMNHELRLFNFTSKLELYSIWLTSIHRRTQGDRTPMRAWTNKMSMRVRALVGTHVHMGACVRACVCVCVRDMCVIVYACE